MGSVKCTRGRGYGERRTLSEATFNNGGVLWVCVGGVLEVFWMCFRVCVGNVWGKCWKDCGGVLGCFGGCCGKLPRALFESTPQSSTK